MAARFTAQGVCYTECSGVWRRRFSKVLPFQGIQPRSVASCDQRSTDPWSLRNAMSRMSRYSSAPSKRRIADGELERLKNVLTWSLTSNVFLDSQFYMLGSKSRTGMPRIQATYFCTTSGATVWPRNVSQFQHAGTEITNQSRQVVSVEVLKAKPKPSQSPIPPPQLRKSSRVCCVSVLLGLGEKIIPAVRGALVVVQSVGRCLVCLYA
jgi:hypothetical protein